MRIGIVTSCRDFHGVVINHALRQRGHEGFILANDLHCVFPGYGWNTAGEVSFNDVEGRSIPLDSLDLIWVRRLNTSQLMNFETAPEARELINRDVRDAVIGSLASCYSGPMVNPVTGFHFGENKLWQLRLATQAGLQVPETLVTQQIETLSAFLDRHGGRCVTKPIRGSRMRPFYAVEVNRDLLDHPEVVSTAPTLYQQLVPGDTHLRLAMFGTRAIGVRIHAEMLDWRKESTTLQASPWEGALDEVTAEAIQRFMRRANLRMGVFDFKWSSESGEIYFLEVNPQGQFLFCEGLTGVDFTNPFVDFLEAEAMSA